MKGAAVRRFANGLLAALIASVEGRFSVAPVYLYMSRRRETVRRRQYSLSVQPSAFVVA